FHHTRQKKRPRVLGSFVLNVLFDRCQLQVHAQRIIPMELHLFRRRNFRHRCHRLLLELLLFELRTPYWPDMIVCGRHDFTQRPPTAARCSSEACELSRRTRACGMTPLARKFSIWVASNPSSSNTCSVCSPSSGATPGLAFGDSSITTGLSTVSVGL